MEISKNKLIGIVVTSISVIILSISALIFMLYKQEKRTYTKMITQESKEKQKDQKKKKEEIIQWLNMDKLNLSKDEIEKLKKEVITKNEKLEMYKIQDVDKYGDVTNENGTRKFQLKISSYNFWYTVNVTVDGNHNITVNYHKNKFDYDNEVNDFKTDDTLKPD